MTLLLKVMPADAAPQIGLGVGAMLALLAGLVSLRRIRSPNRRLLLAPLKPSGK